MNWLLILITCIFVINNSLACPELEIQDNLLTTVPKDFEAFISSILQALNNESKNIELCKARKEYIEDEDWDKIKSILWNDRRFRNESPDGICHERATLLSYELDRMGYKSEKIYIGGSILTSIKRDKGYQSYRYGNHIANIVTIREKDGTLKKYVLDPMFSDGLMEIEEYIKSLALPDAKFPDSPFVLQKNLTYRIVPGHTEPNPALPLNLQQYSNLAYCGFSKKILENYRKTISSVKQSSSPWFASAQESELAYLYYHYQATLDGYDYSSKNIYENIFRIYNSLPKLTAEQSKKDYLKKFIK